MVTKSESSKKKDSDLVSVVKDINADIDAKAESKTPIKAEEELEYRLKELDAFKQKDRLKVLQQNLLYYVFVMIVVGTPLWWITTSPYRAALQKIDPTIDDFRVPFNLTFHIDMNSKDQIIVDEILKNLANDELIQISANTRSYKSPNVAFDSPVDYSLNLVFLSAQEFERRKFAQMAEFVAPTVVAVRSDAAEPSAVRAQRITQITREILGVERMRIAADDEALKNLTVWDRVPVSALTHLQLIFLHENGHKNDKVEQSIIEGAQRLAAFVSKYGALVDISVTHLWDFDVESYVSTAASAEERIFHSASTEQFVTEVDKYAQWIGDGIGQPLIKAAFLMGQKPIRIIDEEKTGIIVASWGGITTAFDSTNRPLSALFDILRAQLNVRRIDPTSTAITPMNPKSLEAEYEWHRFAAQSYAENVRRARDALRSVHSLRAKIEDMVVSREVAVDVYESHEVLAGALTRARNRGQMDTDAVLRARILAERAVKHPSTLQLLNFPLEQRYAIYIPLFLPIFAHVWSPTVRLIKAFVGQMRSTLRPQPGGSNSQYFPFLR